LGLFSISHLSLSLFSFFLRASFLEVDGRAHYLSSQSLFEQKYACKFGAFETKDYSARLSVDIDSSNVTGEETHREREREREIGRERDNRITATHREIRRERHSTQSNRDTRRETHSTQSNRDTQRDTQHTEQ
jgi:hypothetical protein